jgi:hypothetical protein
MCPPCPQRQTGKGPARSPKRSRIVPEGLPAEKLCPTEAPCPKRGANKLDPWAAQLVVHVRVPRKPLTMVTSPISSVGLSCRDGVAAFFPSVSSNIHPETRACRGGRSEYASFWYPLVPLLLCCVGRPEKCSFSEVPHPMLRLCRRSQRSMQGGGRRKMYRASQDPKW